MTTINVLRLTALVVALAAPLAACAPAYEGAPYDHSDRYKNSNGTQEMGAPGAAGRD
jgi:hypothetical protein